MDVTKPYEFVGFGAMDVTKPYKFIGFGAMDVTKPYEFVGFGALILQAKASVRCMCRFCGCTRQEVPSIKCPSTPRGPTFIILRNVF